MELKELSYWALYTIVTGIAISMIYISGMNISEEKQMSRISAIIFLLALIVFYLAKKKEVEFLWMVKYTVFFFLGIFGLYLIIQFLGSFAGYDLISYHGVAILATLIVIYFIYKFFYRVVKDVSN